MASQEARQRAIKQAVATVHAWPAYMHAAACGCVKHDPASTCECPTCSERG